MLHELLSSYLMAVSEVVSGLREGHVEVYEEEILTPDRVNVRVRFRFMNGSLLEINEAVHVQEKVVRHMGYRYHFQDKQGDVVFRYDNTPHFREISTFPDHKHTRTEVAPANRPQIIEVIDEVKRLIGS